MTQTFRPDTGNRFFRFSLTPEDEQTALQVSPLFLAYLQNKIADYAGAVVEKPLTFSANPAEQVTAIIEDTRRRTFVEAYEELLSELTQPVSSNQSE